MTIRRRILLGATAAPLALPALAQAPFPNRSLRVVVPFAPGGAEDITGRVLGERLQAVRGQTVVVRNRGGAGGNIGAEFVARSGKDGYTMLRGSG